MSPRGLTWGGLCAAAIAGAALAGERIRMIETFDLPGAAPGVVWANPTLAQEATQWVPSIVRDEGGSNGMLRLTSSAGTDANCTWQYHRDLDLGRDDGFILRVRSSRPVAEVRVSVAGGQGNLYAVFGSGTAWSDVRLRFDECFGINRFDRHRIHWLTVNPADNVPSPIRFDVDWIAAWRDAAPHPARRSIRVVEPPRDTWMAVVPSTVEFELSNTMKVSTGNGGTRLLYFTGETPYERDRQIFYTWRALPHDLAGTTGLKLVVALVPPEPRVLLKFKLEESGGEQFLLLQDSPGGEAALSLPYGDFIPDASANKMVPPRSQNGVLDLGDVTKFGIEILPLTEKRVRGTLDIREAWAVRL